MTDAWNQSWRAAMAEQFGTEGFEMSENTPTQDLPMSRADIERARHSLTPASHGSLCDTADAAHDLLAENERLRTERDEACCERDNQLYEAEDYKAAFSRESERLRTSKATLAEAMGVLEFYAFGWHRSVASVFDDPPSEPGPWEAGDHHLEDNGKRARKFLEQHGEKP